jgi:putative DNA primase/helicase
MSADTRAHCKDRMALTFQDLPIGEHRVPCPECVKRPSDKTLGVTVDHVGGVWHCFRCGAAGGWRADRQYARPGATVPPTRPDRHLALASNWLALWRTLAPIRGTAEAYLQARSCALPPADGDLRYTESLQHPSGYIGPALVALVTDAVTRESLTLHRTWIRPDGSKADVDPPRLLLGKHRKQGGVIRLWPDDAVMTGLAIAEGIETALTVAEVFTPVWSAIDAGNLAALPVLAGIESLLIVADHDDAGLRAAEQCADRWYRAGCKVRIAKSPIPGQDLNDYARKVA